MEIEDQEDPQRGGPRGNNRGSRWNSEPPSDDVQSRLRNLAENRGDHRPGGDFPPDHGPGGPGWNGPPDGGPPDRGKSQFLFIYFVILKLRLSRICMLYIVRNESSVLAHLEF